MGLLSYSVTLYAGTNRGRWVADVRSLDHAIETARRAVTHPTATLAVVTRNADGVMVWCSDGVRETYADREGVVSIA